MEEDYVDDLEHVCCRVVKDPGAKSSFIIYDTGVKRLKNIFPKELHTILEWPLALIMALGGRSRPI